MRLLLILSLILAATDAASIKKGQGQTYTAAVYDNPIAGEKLMRSDINSRTQALQVAEQNLLVLEEQARSAHEQGADILVFSEYGINGIITDRKAVSYFLETIPDPRKGAPFCPCEEIDSTGREILTRLSCAAKDNSLYVAANIGDKQLCSDEPECPSNKFYQYNTEVVFDKKGCLVARYHKEHLFDTEKRFWDVPPTTDIAYFDTEFGRFGLMICFDAVFKSPAVDLVEKYGITDVIFSTGWMNVFPHYVSVGYHSGWARALGVNYLTSNIHRPKSRLIGSGIYTPDGIAAYRYSRKSATGQLLVAKIPINKKKDRLTIGTGQHIGVAENLSTEPFLNKYKYNFTRLEGLSGKTSICYGDVCCAVEFQREHDRELHALGVYNGMHHKGVYYLEVCVLVRCKNNQEYECGRTPGDISSNVFRSFTLSAYMNTRYAFPSVIYEGFDFAGSWKFVDSGQVKSIISHDKKPLLSAVLIGRNFEKDVV